MNYVWVDSEWMTYADNGALLASSRAQNGAKSVISTPNSSAQFYGFRMFRATSQQGPRFDVQKAEQYNSGLNTALGIVSAKRQQLIDKNQDNIVFETGGATLRGNEMIIPRSYVKLLRGGRDGAPGFDQTMYAHRVAHEFLPFRSFTTTVEFDRGTGFIARI